MAKAARASCSSRQTVVANGDGRCRLAYIATQWQGWGRTMRKFERNAFAADYAAMLAISDQRKADNKAAQVRAMQNAELCAELLAQASRRGESGINWRGYFQTSGIA